MGSALGGTADAMSTWEKRLFDKGWGAPTWPHADGGAGFDIMQQAIWNEECARASVPPIVGNIGKGMVGPTIITNGSEAQKKKYLPKILSGEEIWCQGFSEPSAGTDLAGLQARAVKDGDDWVITGQKTWTSLAKGADWCFYLARTDPDLPKHRGLTGFIVDMKSPGIEIRPIRQITGGSTFNDMFFDKVRVPNENVLGDVNDGWHVAMSNLAHERSGQSSAMQYRATLDRLRDLAKRVQRNGIPRSKDPDIRNRLTQLFFDVHAHTYTGYRNLTGQLKGGIPGPEVYVGKVATGPMVQRMDALGMELLGPYAPLTMGSPEAQDYGMWSMNWLSSRAITIYGGTLEVNRNQIAERALGLPSWKTAARMAQQGKEVG